MKNITFTWLPRARREGERLVVDSLSLIWLALILTTIIYTACTL